MNWNNNDTKYIIKKVVIYILICIAMFIIGTWKTHAATIDTYNLGSYECYGNTTTTNKGHWAIAGDWFTGCQLDGLTGYNYYSPTISGYDNTNVDITGLFYHYSSVVPVLKINGYTCETYPGGFNNSQQSEAGGYVIQRENYSTLTGFICRNVVLNNGQFTLNVKSPLTSSNVGTSGPSGISFLSITNSSSDTQAINENTQAVEDVNNSINNTDISGANSDADNLTNNQAFNDSTGLESVIQLPFNMINQLSNTCQPIEITIPFLNYSGTIPCMSTIYTQHFGNLYNLIKLVINGFLIYRILLKVYELVHSARQPDEDKLEVIEL